jgi:DNA-binding transcriptional LysR family regulator
VASAIDAGFLALLPCYLGDGEPDLVRALPKLVAELVGELWMVIHADLKGTARVRTFFDLVGEGLASERELFEGRRRAEDRP